ncbi:Uncharacterised protein [Candidatus Bilamarchaeum dharawalense]|uniref:Nucleoside 2-deoxyribosyltransferase n=1 Tax=Candidatus Bilamarchaeum dharawalense TaxID=2885759 RepID=A0A5E4LT02_9ARCH|nr:Uncharacterised protein [Candidatus Bilamarchaeum dharawalense]
MTTTLRYKNPENLLGQEAKNKFAAWKDKWEKDGKKPLIYLAAHIYGYTNDKDEEMRKNNSRIVDLLEESGFAVFLPQRDNPFGVLKGNSIGWEMAIVDELAIRIADIVFAVGGFGKDTSWEIGLAAGLGKLTLLHLPTREAAEYHKEDWMLLRNISLLFASAEAADVMRESIASPPTCGIFPIVDAGEIPMKIHLLHSIDKMGKVITGG